MGMSLEELLALLPDNDVGAIDAADIRVVTTELFTLAQTAMTDAAQATSVAGEPTARSVCSAMRQHRLGPMQQRPRPRRPLRRRLHPLRSPLHPLHR